MIFIVKLWYVNTSGINISADLGGRRKNKKKILED